MPERKIFVVFPHDFFELKSGINKRFFELIKYLKDRNFEIDLFGVKHLESKWRNEKFNKPEPLINKLFLYDFRKGFIKEFFTSGHIRNFYFNKTFHLGRLEHLPDFAFRGMRNMFKRIVHENRYDFILIGYVYWANLLKEEIPSHVTPILTLEDFVTKNLYDARKGAINNEILMKEELERVNLFDRVICLSYEELEFFSANARNPSYYYIPIFMQEKRIEHTGKTYDILFVGSNNFSNINGMRWFFEQVYPLLKTDLKIVIVGKIARHTPEFPNIKKINYIENLDDIYAQSKMTINPLQDGTGMKVKMIESLAFGLPVVNTSKGLCGINPGIINKFIIADEPVTFAYEIERLIYDKPYYFEQCEKARRIFIDNFDIAVAKKELDKVFSHL
jgi:glycosyltransferase involved in cell wall biosynthesis